MLYENDQVMKAFKIYSRLAVDGIVEKDEFREYIVNDTIRGLVGQFAKEVDSTIFVAGDFIYMVPLSMRSVFHVSNESIKRDHLPTKSLNIDIYLMYVTTIILFGEFYEGYQSTSPTRDFISTEEWLTRVNERIESLHEHDEEELKELEKEYDYNWIGIIEKWEPLDDLKENVKKQSARTKSRLSILNTTKKFLEEQELVKDIGNDEIELTEKAKTIIQRYYMEYEFNRGILEFIYGLESSEGESTDASHI